MAMLYAIDVPSAAGLGLGVLAHARHLAAVEVSVGPRAAAQRALVSRGPRAHMGFCALKPGRAPWTPEEAGNAVWQSFVAVPVQRIEQGAS